MNEKASLAFSSLRGCFKNRLDTIQPLAEKENLINHRDEDNGWDPQNFQDLNVVGVGDLDLRDRHLGLHLDIPIRRLKAVSLTQRELFAMHIEQSMIGFVLASLLRFAFHAKLYRENTRIFYACL